MGEGIHTISKGVKKTDRSYLHDTDSGLNRREAYTVNKLENKIRNRKTEKGYVIGSDGNVIAESHRGSRRSARFYKSDMMKSKDAIVIHNHPNAEMGGTMAAQIGLPFSNNDIENAVNYNLKEVRAVTPNYTYSIRRPKGGWGNKEAIYKALREWENEADKNFYDYKYSKGRKGASINETFDRGNVGGQWSAWKSFMKKTGLTITRKKG